jgi:hypothetical protein
VRQLTHNAQHIMNTKLHTYADFCYLVCVKLLELELLNSTTSCLNFSIRSLIHCLYSCDPTFLLAAVSFKDENGNIISSSKSLLRQDPKYSAEVPIAKDLLSLLLPRVNFSYVLVAVHL